MAVKYRVHCMDRTTFQPRVFEFFHVQQAEYFHEKIRSGRFPSLQLSFFLRSTLEKVDTGPPPVRNRGKTAFERMFTPKQRARMRHMATADGVRGRIKTITFYGGKA